MRITKTDLKRIIESINESEYIMYILRLDIAYGGYRVDFREKDSNRLKYASSRMTARECYCYLAGIRNGFFYTKPF